MKKVLLTCAALALLFTACKKDDGSTGSSDRKTNLTSSSWRIISMSVEVQYPAPIGTQTIDGLTAFQACVKDNKYIFNSNNTSTTDEGVTKCNSSDPQQKTSGTWALLNGDTKLQVTDPASSGPITSITADILQLDNSTLKIKYNDASGGIQTVTTTTYGR